ncbi:MAG: ATPase [Hydrogenophilales bacterium RIFOXYD1_FULL_62_11]|nr:MAG: ATPase [Hydrogenophilales bacterium RIFOXYD1_FULL_62_11]
MKERFAGFQSVRRDRLIQESRHDPYKAKHKLPEPTVCPQCGAVFHDGHWQWLVKPAQANEAMCPACHRIHDDFPAGYLTVAGTFFKDHREELLHLARNEETRAKTEHPLKRIMKIEDQDGDTLITTTDIHLARGIGDALHHAYQGELEYHYNEQENLLRVMWTR